MKIILPALVLALAGLTTIGVIGASAEDTDKPYFSIVQKLAQRFNLNEAEVQAVFDESRGQHQSQMQLRFEEKLNQAVTDGELTEGQKQAILEKHDQLKSMRQTSWGEQPDQSPQERKNIMDAQRQELKNWAEENNINLKYFFGGFKSGMRGGWGIR